MRLQPVTIVLGEASWIVRPLTVAQVQAIEPLVFTALDSKTGSIATAVAILRVALERDHPAAAETLEACEGGAPEIAAAVRHVLALGGFLPRGEPQPGEVLAGAAPASTGLASTLG